MEYVPAVALVVSVFLSMIAFLATSLIGVLVWNAKGVVSDARDNGVKLAGHETRIAVIESSDLQKRLTAVETDLGEIKGDVKIVKHWVERQENNRS